MTDFCIPATGNGLMTNHDTFLTVSSGPSHNLDPADGEVEVHIKVEGCCGEFAQAWFRVSELKTAIEAAEKEQDPND